MQSQYTIFYDSNHLKSTRLCQLSAIYFW